MKIEIIDGNDGFEREVNGSIDLDSGYNYDWELYTYDGFTSIHLIDCEAEINLEEEDDLEQIGLTEDEGIEIYDAILDFVNNNGYDFIGEDFE